MRIHKLPALLTEFHIDALVIDTPIDLFYLLGVELSLGRFVFDREGGTLFVDGRYFEGCNALKGIRVVLTSGYGPESAFFREWKWKDRRVGFDAATTSYVEFENFSDLGAEWIALKTPLRSLREIKEKEEIEILERAAHLAVQGFEYLCTCVKEGITEKELATLLQMFWLKEGGERLAFAPHIAFGAHASQPHYHSGKTALNRGDSILIDIGVVIEGYHSDLTRVIAFGRSSSLIEEIYACVYKAYKAAVELCRPGVKIGELDRAARKVIEEAGYGERFTHGLGHGVGLEIHEAPRVRSGNPDGERALLPGMVLTIEPGIYLPNEGGVRLEDTLLITESGCRVLTIPSFPPTLSVFS